MGRPGTARITLELDPGDPIHGRIGRELEQGESFRGWIELAGKLDRLRGAPQRSVTTTDAKPPAEGARSDT